MGIPRKARESSLQILFQLEFDASPPDEVIQRFWEGKKAPAEERELSDRLVQGIIANHTKIDSIIQSVSENWRISRMVLVDRNILRIATYELFFGDDLAPAIVINEAIEIAKKFSDDQSANFINGILDALHKKTDQIKQSLKEEAHE